MWETAVFNRPVLDCTVISRNKAAVRSIEPDTAVLASWSPVKALFPVAPTGRSAKPWLIVVPDAPVADVPMLDSIIHVCVVDAVAAALTHERSVRAVPDPHPDTVHNLTLKVHAGVCNATVVHVPDADTAMTLLAVLR